ncbi:MAG: transcription termination/antitermination protein NusG, partial [Pseudonocardiales bacterium]|nr:transcription termination/antitermination protein NusG [Pseudonocardiales bacterium]
MSEYNDAVQNEESAAEPRSEAAEQGPADLVEAARLLGAGEDESALSAADADEAAELVETPADAPAAEADETPAEAPAAEAPATDVAEPAAAAGDVAAAEIADAGETADETADEDEDEDPVETLRRELKAQFGDWYVVHSYAGYENKVKTNLESRIQTLDMEDYIFQVEVPTDEVVEIKNGKRQQVVRKKLPGYLFVRMDLT